METTTSTDSTTDTSNDTSVQYESGSYGSSGFSFASFTLLQQSADTTNDTDLSNTSATESGSKTDDQVRDGYTTDNGSDIFTDGDSSTDTMLGDEATDSFRISELGSYGSSGVRI